MKYGSVACLRCKGTGQVDCPICEGTGEAETRMSKELNKLKSEYPEIGESHEKVFRYAFMCGWDARQSN